jgi:hypothetical protein
MSLQSEPASCVALVILLHYCHLTNFFWMFVEGKEIKFTFKAAPPNLMKRQKTKYIKIYLNFMKTLTKK